MKHKKHISTLTYTAMGVTALLLFGSFALLAVSAAAAWKAPGFASICFFLLMIFAAFTAVRMTLQQCRTGVNFLPDRVEFHVEDEPVSVAYRQLASMELVNNTEPLKPKQRLLSGAQFIFHLKDGSVRIVPVPKLHRSTGKRILDRIQKMQREANG